MLLANESPFVLISQSSVDTVNPWIALSNEDKDASKSAPIDSCIMFSRKSCNIVVPPLTSLPSAVSSETLTSSTLPPFHEDAPHPSFHPHRLADFRSLHALQTASNDLLNVRQSVMKWSGLSLVCIWCGERLWARSRWRERRGWRLEIGSFSLSRLKTETVVPYLAH